MKKQSNRVLDANGNFVPFPVEEIKKEIDAEKLDGAVLQDHIEALKEPEQKLKNAPKKSTSYHDQLKNTKSQNLKKTLINTYSHDDD